MDEKKVNLIKSQEEEILLKAREIEKSRALNETNIPKMDLERCYEYMENLECTIYRNIAFSDMVLAYNKHPKEVLEKLKLRIKQLNGNYNLYKKK